MARLYANENFPFAAVEELRRLGHDVLTSQEAGNAHQRIPDDEVLQFATGDKRAVSTFNRRDFRHLHGRSGDHAGIIICTMDSDIAALCDRIHSALGGTAELNGELVSITRPPNPGLGQGNP